MNHRGIWRCLAVLGFIWAISLPPSVSANPPFLSNVFIRATGIRLNLATNEEIGTLRYNAAITSMQYYAPLGPSNTPGWTNVGAGLGFPLIRDVSAAGFNITNIGKVVATQGLFNSLSQTHPIPYQFLQVHPTGGHTYTFGTRLTTNFAEWAAAFGDTNNMDDIYPGQLLSYGGSVYVVKSPIYETNYVPYTLNPRPAFPTATNFALFVAQGASGATGPAGANALDGVGNIQYGVWDTGRSYIYSTSTPIVVSYGGRWYDLLVSNSNVPPTSGGATSYWAISVDKGASGTLLGLTNLVLRGQYDSGQPYVSNDVVYYAGNTFVKWTNDASTGVAPSLTPTNQVGTNSPYWDVLVAKGQMGIQGEDGNVISYSYFITNQFNVNFVTGVNEYVNSPFSNATAKFYVQKGTAPDATNTFAWATPIWTSTLANSSSGNALIMSNGNSHMHLRLFTNYLQFVSVTESTNNSLGTVTGATLYLNIKTNLGGGGGTVDLTGLSNSVVSLSNSVISLSNSLAAVSNKFVTLSNEVAVLQTNALLKTGGIMSGDINFTNAGISSLDFIEFDAAPTSAVSARRMIWNPSRSTISFGLNALQTDLGQQLMLYAKNDDTNTLSKGEVVFISGATGDNPTIKRASHDSETLSARTIGIMAENVTVNNSGFVVTRGTVYNLNTTNFVEGQGVYLGLNGTLQTNLPTAPLHGVFIGVVERVHQNAGQIYVAIQNYQELRELSDVFVNGASNNYVLTYVAASNRWEAKPSQGGGGSVSWSNSWSLPIVDANTNTYLLPLAPTNYVLVSMATNATPQFVSFPASTNILIQSGIGLVTVDLSTAQMVMVPDIPVSTNLTNASAVSYKMLKDYVTANALAGTNPVITSISSGSPYLIVTNPTGPAVGLGVNISPAVDWGYRFEGSVNGGWARTLGVALDDISTDATTNIDSYAAFLFTVSTTPITNTLYGEFTLPNYGASYPLKVRANQGSGTVIFTATDGSTVSVSTQTIAAANTTYTTNVLLTSTAVTNVKVQVIMSTTNANNMYRIGIGR